MKEVTGPNMQQEEPTMARRFFGSGNGNQNHNLPQKAKGTQIRCVSPFGVVLLIAVCNLIAFQNGTSKVGLSLSELNSIIRLPATSTFVSPPPSSLNASDAFAVVEESSIHDRIGSNLDEESSNYKSSSRGTNNIATKSTGSRPVAMSPGKQQFEMFRPSWNSSTSSWNFPLPSSKFTHHIYFKDCGCLE